MAKSPSPKGDRSVKIGPYEVIKRIGAGGMGTVYLARDSDLGRLVALKVLPSDLTNKAEAVGRFRQEAQHAAKLRHENIVTIYGCGEHKGLHYLAMEYVEGCNLHEHIDRHGKMAPEDARQLMIQAAKALVCAHEQSIVHRDIKPSNFLLAADANPFAVKLTDFGLARTVDDAEGKMTRSGTTVGTVDYISPEQARNSRSADIRSDIYSLGCTLYHMLAARAPFPDGDLTERLLKHVEAEPPDILQFNPNIPPGIVHILKKMLAKKPEDRYQTPAQLLADLGNPPKTPVVSAREALEMLAEASGEKARISRPSSMQETRRQMKDATSSIPAKVPPVAADLKLHYRKKKNERRQRPEKSHIGAEEMTSPLVLEGLGPWLAVIGGIAAIALIVMAIMFQWGGKTDVRKDINVADTGSESNGGERKDIAKQAKQMMQDLKKDAVKRRDGEDSAVSKAALEEMKTAGEIPDIDEPGSKMNDEMKRIFAQRPSNSSAKHLEEITGYYKEGDQAGPGQTPPGVNSGQVPGSPSNGSGSVSPPTNNGNSAGPTNANNGSNPGKPATTNNNSAGPTKGNTSPDSSEQPGGKTTGQSAPANPQTGSQSSTPPNSPNPSQGTTSPEIKSPSTPTQTPNASTQTPNVATQTPSSSTQTPSTPTQTPNASGPVPSAGSANPGNPGPGKAAGGGTKRPPKANVMQVRRDLEGSSKAGFGSIAAALSQIAASDTATVIEIRDNGPFFESSLNVANQSIVLRGAGGYRPLIVLTNSNDPYLFAVQNGNLALQGVDLALKVREGQQNIEGGLIRLGSGNLLLEDCTLSLAGTTRNGLKAVRLDGVATGDAQCAATLRRCFLRGSDMVAIDLQGPGCSVLTENCLVVGHDHPLIQVRGQANERPSSLRIAHTTIVAGQQLCLVDASTPREFEKPTQLVFWDSLLAHSGPTEGSELWKLGKNVSLQNVQWRAVNCLYAGWQTLLSHEGGKIPASDVAGWHALIHQESGDKAVAFSWPAYLPPETDRITSALFRTIGTAAAFRDSTGRGAVGCAVVDLPPVRLSWPSYTYERAATPAVDTRAPDRAPEIPAPNDGHYHGGRIDVARTDLGEHLQRLQDAEQLASRVVIHISGRGTAYVTPFRLKDVHLTIYADAGNPAVLTPKPGSAADALMRIENGSCELLGVHLAPPTGDKGADIGTFVQTKNANLRMIGCRVKGMVGKNAVRTLIAFAGSGDSAAEQSRECVIADGILQTTGSILRLMNNGCRLRIQNSVLVAGEDLLILEPGSLNGPLNLNCVLDHDTIAARNAVVHVQDVTAGTTPLDAAAVQTRACVFVNPFGDLPPRAGLLAFEDLALPHGLISWQPDANAYDKQVGFGMSNRESGRETEISPETCKRIWGPLADRRGVVFEGSGRDFKIEQPNWDRLSLSPATRAKFKGTQPGADFEQLGIGKR